MKPSCGIRLPPDRYCLSSVNYKLRNVKKVIQALFAAFIESQSSILITNFVLLCFLTQVSVPPGSIGRLGTATSFIQGSLGGSNTLKLQANKAQGATLAGVKRGNLLTTVARTQSITTPKPVIKFSQGKM